MLLKRATPGLLSKYSQFWLYNGGILVERVCSKSIDIAYYFPFSSKLFFNYLSRTTASARLELRFSLPLIVRSGEHSLEWRFSQGACRRWRPRSDDSDGREWFQLSIIPMLLRPAIATTFLHLSRNCSQLVLAFDNAVTISLRPLAIYFPDSSIISFYRSRIRTNLFRDRVFIVPSIFICKTSVWKNCATLNQFYFVEIIFDFRYSSHYDYYR